jgi:hypothetical protein
VSETGVDPRYDAEPRLDPFQSRRSRPGTFKSVARYKDMRPLWGLGLLAASLAIAGCNPSAATGQIPSGPPGQCPVGTPSTIDRVDFVIVKGIQYEGAMASIGRGLTDQDLGKPVDRVRCTLSDLSFAPSYNEMQNGMRRRCPQARCSMRSMVTLLLSGSRHGETARSCSMKPT